MRRRLVALVALVALAGLPLRPIVACTMPAAGAASHGAHDTAATPSGTHDAAHDMMRHDAAHDATPVPSPDDVPPPHADCPHAMSCVAVAPLPAGAVAFVAEVADCGVEGAPVAALADSPSALDPPPPRR